MSANVVVKVQVEKLTKFGYADSEGYVSYSKNLSDSDRALVVPGASFEAELYTAPSGARYLNKIVARAAHVSAPKAELVGAQTSTDSPLNKVVDTERAKKFTPKFTKKADDADKMTKADWNAKDRNMMIGGRSHDAAVIVAAMVNVRSLDVTTALDIYAALLDGMLKIAEEVK
jgi:hypothetical protein